MNDTFSEMCLSPWCDAFGDADGDVNGDVNGDAVLSRFQVHRMMKGKEQHEHYRPMEKNHVVKILDDGKVSVGTFPFLLHP